MTKQAESMHDQWCQCDDCHEEDRMIDARLAGIPFDCIDFEDLILERQERDGWADT